jgi:hypothetical protein
MRKTSIVRRAVLAAILVLGASVSMGVILTDLAPIEPPVSRQAASVPIISPWTTVVTSLAAADNSGNSVTTIAQVTAAHATSLQLNVSAAAQIKIRMKYDDGITFSVLPVVEVFGVDSSGAVGKLRSKTGAITATLTAAATDAQDGTYGYTTPDDSCVFFTEGCRWVVVGVKTACTVSAGTAALTYAQVKALPADSAGGDDTVLAGYVDGLEGGLGTATTAAVDGDTNGSAVAHLRGINKKLAGNVAVTEASASAMAADLNELTAAPVAKAPTFLAAVIIGTPGTPTALAANETYFVEAVLTAGRATAANANLISIGGNTAYTTQRQFEMAPGDTRVIRARPGTKLDLNDWYIDGVNTDDGVRIEYIAP